MPNHPHLTFITGNEIKFQVAQQVLRGSGLMLERSTLDLPEIQSSRVEEIAVFSAQWACQHLDRPVAVTDAGFYIETLNGFPGPFVKFTNAWLSAQDYLSLLLGKLERRIVVRDCLAYCRPHEKPLTFCTAYQGTLATEPGRDGGNPIEQILIPAGYSVPISEIAPDEMVAYWSRASVWRELKRYLAA